MLAEELRPKNPPHVRMSQCQAPVPTNEHWNKSWLQKRRETAIRKGYDPEKCTRGGTVRIDGVILCRQHAGSLAVEELIKLSRAEHLVEEQTNE